MERMRVMRSLLGLLGMYVLITVVVIGWSLGLAFLLHWLVPAIDLGSALVSGVIATGISLYVFGRLMTLPPLDTVEEEEPLTAAQLTTYLTTPRPPQRKGTRRRS
jgi:hypothetical protein